MFEKVIGASLSARESASMTHCIHGRMIEDILTREGKRSGKVRCLECGTTFDDPFSEKKCSTHAVPLSDQI